MKCLAAVILAIGILSSEVFAAEIPVRSSRSVREQFDSYSELLRKEILFSKEKDRKKRFSLLNHALEQMKILRREIESTENPDVAHMDQLISSLEALPSKKKFKRKNCGEYQAALTAASQTPHELALDFIKSLCQ